MKEMNELLRLAGCEDVSNVPARSNLNEGIRDYIPRGGKMDGGMFFGQGTDEQIEKAKLIAKVKQMRGDRFGRVSSDDLKHFDEYKAEYDEMMGIEDEVPALGYDNLDDLDEVFNQELSKFDDEESKEEKPVEECGDNKPLEEDFGNATSVTPYKDALYDALEDGLIDAVTLAKELIIEMSEDDAKDTCKILEIPCGEEDLEECGDQPLKEGLRDYIPRAGRLAPNGEKIPHTGFIGQGTDEQMRKAQIIAYVKGMRGERFGRVSKADLDNFAEFEAEYNAMNDSNVENDTEFNDELDEAIYGKKSK